MSLTVGKFDFNSLVMAENFWEHYIAGDLLYIILAASLNKCCNSFLDT
jgi:hypothetical protein